MPRVREFEPEEVLQECMELFWKQGYVDTSMRDVASHTGVAHAGLYSAFGSKRSLFVRCLNRYRDTILRPMMMPVAAPESGRAEIEGFFAGLGEAMSAGMFTWGCFLCNSAVEFADDGGPILKEVRENFEQMLAAFEGALRRAKDRGEVRATLDPAAMASALVGAFAGAAVMLRAGIPVPQVLGGIDVTLSRLD